MRTILRRTTYTSCIAVLLAAVACGSLDVSNPNEPDQRRALSDPGTLPSIVGGTFSTWFNTVQGMEGTGPLVTMADSYTASWNNFNMRLYSSEPRDSWQNDPSAAARTAVEAYWYNMYSMLSSANDVLAAIRVNNVKLKTASDTKMVEASAVLAQGMALSILALNYDQGFVIDEKTDLTTLQFSPRVQIRDAAVAKLTEAATIAAANSFTTPGDWTGAPAGPTYTNTQIAQLARTFAAMTLAMYPRNAAENTSASWSQIATFASQGISSGAAFDFNFTQNGAQEEGPFFDRVKAWSNDITTMRLDTRVANLMDPATQKTPWPSPGGNPPPNSPDKRLADGVNGTDYRWDASAIFRPARGQYHQSNIGHVRYEYASFNDPGGSGGGAGTVPAITATLNDLLWAEGLIRSGGDLVKAASLINKTRVGRGGLTPVTIASGTAGLLSALQYEQDVELPGLGAVPYYNRRRIDGLQPQTPRQMPVPAKELGVLQKELYTFGGAANPAGMNRLPSEGATVLNVRQIAEEMRRESSQRWGKIQLR